MSILDDFDRELARCDAEIKAMQEQPPVKPAFLTTMGIHDWQYEKRIIERLRDRVLTGGAE